MKKHIHFVLLVLGTVAFLWTMRMYTSPLRPPEGPPVITAGMDAAAVLSNYQFGYINAYNMHTEFIMKSSFKVFAIYLAFVVLVFSHRSFYGFSRPVNGGSAPSSLPN